MRIEFDEKEVYRLLRKHLSDVFGFDLRFEFSQSRYGCITADSREQYWVHPDTVSEEYEKLKLMAAEKSA